MLFQLFFLMIRRPTGSIRTDTLFPYTTSSDLHLAPPETDGSTIFFGSRRDRFTCPPFPANHCCGREVHEKMDCSRRMGRIVGNDRRIRRARQLRSEEHTSELQPLMRISYAVFCLKKKINTIITATLCVT